MPRIDDRHVLPVDDLLPTRVQLTRAMTALATDGMPPEDRLLVPVDRQVDRLHAVGVAEQALGLDRALEVFIAVLVPGGEVPLLLLAVP